MDMQHENQTILDPFMDLILDSPALVPPPGIQSNLTDPPNRRGLSLGILIPCIVIVITMTLMRLFVKFFIIKKMHLEDYFLLVALAFEIGHIAPAFCIHTYAPVVHQWDISIRNIRRFLLHFHVAAIFYDMTILTLKLAIFLQFLRVLIPRGDRSITFWITHIFLWANTIFYIIIVFIDVFTCKPMVKLWDPLITSGKCMNTPIHYLICASFNFALDAAILIWTQRVIWSLHVSTARKLKLGMFFIAGLIACICGGLRVYMTFQLLRTKDRVYTAGIMALFTYPETASGFLILCLPVIPKFINYVMAKVFPETPTIVTNIKKKLVPKKENSPYTYLARENESKNKRQQRSLWHISTISLISQSSIESIETERRLSDAESSESEKDAE